MTTISSSPSARDSEQEKNIHTNRSEKLLDTGAQIVRYGMIGGSLVAAVWIVGIAAHYVYIGDWTSLENKGVDLIKLAAAYFVGWLNKVDVSPKPPITDSSNS